MSQACHIDKWSLCKSSIHHFLFVDRSPGQRRRRRSGTFAKLPASPYPARLNRAQDALALYQTAAASPIPHLDWEQHIQAGIRDAKAALASGKAIAAGAQ